LTQQPGRTGETTLEHVIPRIGALKLHGLDEPRLLKLFATGAVKAGVNPKVIIERIGHADVGFFLQTYAHVLKNADRQAAEEAATFLMGDEWVSGSDDETV
jgi:hypothetical protein